MSLELRDLRVDIADRRIVSGIGFTVPDGTFTGLLGPNGSGKSTILKAIYRIHRPATGRVLIDGQDLLALRPRDAARRVAVVAQEFTLEFDFTVAELVMIGRTPHKRGSPPTAPPDHPLNTPTAHTATHRQTAEDVPGRYPVRSGVRHRHRGRPAGHPARIWVDS